MSKREISILLGTVCMVLVFAIFVQTKTIESSATIAQDEKEDKLRQELIQLQEKSETITQNLEKEEVLLEEIRTVVSKNDDQSQKTRQELTNANDLLGLTNLTGPGLVLTLENEKAIIIDSTAQQEQTQNLSHFKTAILRVVNELRNAGAEAISVNGQRIVSNTAIYYAENTITINGEKVMPPFSINAIGTQLYGALTRPEGYLKQLSREGIVTTITQGDVFVPKYNGTYTAEYIKSK